MREFLKAQVALGRSGLRTGGGHVGEFLKAQVALGRSGLRTGGGHVGESLKGHGLALASG